MDTPMFWGDYLTYLHELYVKDMKDWKAEKKKIEKSKNVGFWEKAFDHKAQRLECHEWNEPYAGEKKYQPTLVGYFNWDVKDELPKAVIKYLRD